MAPASMLSIQEKILIYFDLSATEQAELDKEIQRSPELERLFLESQALHKLFQRAEGEDYPDNSALVEFVLFEFQRIENPPGHVVARHARTAEAIRRNPDLRKRVQEIRDNVIRITEPAKDPIERFGRLRETTSRRSTPVGVVTKPRSSMRLHRAVQFALAACVALVAVYGVLFLISWQSQTDRDRLAGLNSIGQAFEDLHFRGASDEREVVSDMAEPLRLLSEARSSTLGLFPSYDLDLVEAAAAVAESIAVDESKPVRTRAQAQYTLGKIRMYQGHDEEAVEALQSVVALQAEGAQDARRLLDYLEQEQLNSE